MPAFAVANALSALATELRPADGWPASSPACRTAPTSASPRWWPPTWSPRRRGRAVALVMLGLLGRQRRRRARPRPGSASTSAGARPTGAVAALALLTVALVLALVPRCPGRPGGDRAPRAQGALQPAGAGYAAGRRGRLRRHVRDVLLHRPDASPTSAASSAGAVPVFLLSFGLGMVAGTWLAGELADWSVFRSLLGSARRHRAWSCCCSSSPHRTAGAPLPVVFLITALGSVLVVNLQLRLMDVAGDGADPRRRDEPRVPQRRQRARRLARRPGDRRRLRLPRPRAGRRRRCRSPARRAALVGHRRITASWPTTPRPARRRAPCPSRPSRTRAPSRSTPYCVKPLASITRRDARCRRRRTPSPAADPARRPRRRERVPTSRQSPGWPPRARARRGGSSSRPRTRRPGVELNHADRGRAPVVVGRVGHRPVRSPRRSPPAAPGRRQEVLAGLVDVYGAGSWPQPALGLRRRSRPRRCAARRRRATAAGAARRPRAPGHVSQGVLRLARVVAQQRAHPGVDGARRAAAASGAACPRR